MLDASAAAAPGIVAADVEEYEEDGEPKCEENNRVLFSMKSASTRVAE